MMNDHQKASRAYKALTDLGVELHSEGKVAASDRLMECIDELSDESLTRFHDIMEAAIAKVKA